MVDSHRLASTQPTPKNQSSACEHAREWYANRQNVAQRGDHEWARRKAWKPRGTRLGA
jgi:hypothetical protein